MAVRALSFRSGLRRWTLFGVSLMGPVAVAWAFPHPADRVIIPGSVVLVVVFLVTVMGSRVAGVVAASSGTLALWYWSIAPTGSWTVRSTEDVQAIIAFFLVGVLAAMLIGTLSQRLRSAAIAEARLGMFAAAQQSLLPDIPSLQRADGASVAAAYGTGASGAVVGGDWYAVIPIARTRIGVAVGDVVGHGFTALAAMAEVRFTFRAAAALCDDGASTVTLLEELLARYGGDRSYGSLAYCSLDTVTGRLQLINAGHPAPVLRRGGRAEVLDAAHGRLLLPGFAQAHRHASEHQLEPGDVVVLYTDGLVERRDEEITRGFERLAAEVAACDAPFEELPAALIGRLTEGSPTDDDIAVCALRWDASAVAAGPDPGTTGEPPRLFWRRPGLTTAREARPGEIVRTPLGDRVATRDQWIVVAEDGSEHLVPDATFLSFYVAAVQPALDEDLDEDAGRPH